MLTRKEFLKTLGAATVSAAISKTAGAKPADPAPNPAPAASNASGSGRAKRVSHSIAIRMNINWAR